MVEGEKKRKEVYTKQWSHGFCINLNGRDHLYLRVISNILLRFQNTETERKTDHQPTVSQRSHRQER